MVEEHVVRDDEVGLIPRTKSMSLEELTINMIDRIVEVTGEQTREAEERSRNCHQELWNLIGFILYPHTHEEITHYANNLKHRLEEK